LHDTDHVTTPPVSVFITVPKKWLMKFSSELGNDSHAAVFVVEDAHGLLQS
jgi:hypothetical protein